MSFPPLHFAQRFCCAVHAFNDFNEWMNEERKFFFLGLVWLGCLSRSRRISIYFHLGMEMSEGRETSDKRREMVNAYGFAYVFGLGFEYFELKFQRNRYFIKKSFNIGVSGELTQFKCACALCVCDAVKWSSIFFICLSVLLVSILFPVELQWPHNPFFSFA